MSTSDFTDEEKTQILRFLGYPDVQSLAASIQLGYPAASQPMFLVVDAFKRLTPTARVEVRKDLEQCICIEAQLAQSRERMRATSLEGLRFNPNEANQLRGELAWWTNRLADDFGAPKNPYSATLAGGTPGGINARTGG